MDANLSWMDPPPPPPPTMLFSEKHNMVVYGNVPAGAVEGAKLLPNGMIALPATLEAMQAARKASLPVVNIMDREYPYPGQNTPFDHQRVMGGFMSLHPKCLNLSDIGTGKTLGTLWPADYLMRKGLAHRALIISTLSTLDETWGDTIFKTFMGTRTSVVLRGSQQSRLNKLEKKCDFYIINHDGLGVGYHRDGHRLTLGPLIQQIIDRADIDLIIVDEATAYKNSGTVRYRVLRALLDKKPYGWLLSGAPTPNAPTDAWSLRRLIDPTVNVNFFDFKARVMRKSGNFRWEPQADAAKTVAKFLQPAIRFNREDCLDLPPQLVERRKVELSDNQKKAFKELRQNMALQMENGTINAINEASLRIKLIQIACGAVYGENKEVHKVDVAPRLAALKEILEEAQGKVIIFSSFTSIVNLLEAEIGKTHKLVKVMGETKNRAEIFKAFQTDPTVRVMVANPAAMAHGVTLTAADTTVWFGPTDNPETYTQANGRYNRAGQTQNMLLVQLYATSIEKEIFDRLEAKQNLQGIILNLMKEGLTNGTAAD